MRVIAILLPIQVKFLVKLMMLDFEVLVERTFRSIRFLAGGYRASVMAIDFIGGSSESFFPVLFAFFSLLDLFCFFLESAEFTPQLISFVDELSHLGNKNNIC